jgi:hypothetical protein
MRHFIFLALVFGFAIPEATADEILNSCKQKWGEDYSMIKFCRDKQMKARQNLRSGPKGRILDACQGKWGEDYSMIKFCRDKQMKARQDLGLN